MSLPVPWSQEHLNILRKGYEDGVPLNTLAKAVGRSPSSCSAMAIRLGIRHPSKVGRSAWTWAEQPAWRNQFSSAEPPTLPYVPGIIVTGRYQMVRPAHVE